MATLTSSGITFPDSSTWSTAWVTDGGIGSWRFALPRTTIPADASTWPNAFSLSETTGSLAASSLAFDLYNNSGAGSKAYHASNGSNVFPASGTENLVYSTSYSGSWRGKYSAQTYFWSDDYNSGYGYEWSGGTFQRIA